MLRNVNHLVLFLDPPRLFLFDSCGSPVNTDGRNRCDRDVAVATNVLALNWGVFMRNPAGRRRKRTLDCVCKVIKSFRPGTAMFT